MSDLEDWAYVLGSVLRYCIVGAIGIGLWIYGPPTWIRAPLCERWIRKMNECQTHKKPEKEIKRAVVACLMDPPGKDKQEGLEALIAMDCADLRD